MLAAEAKKAGIASDDTLLTLIRPIIIIITIIVINLSHLFIAGTKAGELA